MDDKRMIQLLSSLLDEKLHPLNNRIGNLEGHMEKIEDRMENFEGRMEKIEDRMENFERRMENTENEQKVIIGKLDNISKQVADNTEKQNIAAEITVKVAEHDTDIKLLKKFITT